MPAAWGSCWREAGLAVITGGVSRHHGGHANRGEPISREGRAVGLNIELPHEQSANTYQTTSLTFRYFFCAKDDVC